jgi:two-component system, chemotaxis family, chemotaxis protein CheY
VRLELLKILLVDDSPHIRTLLAEILRAIGIQHLFSAGDGSEALHLLRSQPVDLVITDLAMAPMDGVELTRLIRQSPDSANPMLPIVMITGHTTLNRLQAARDAGVNEMLAKPLTARGVLDRLKRVIEQPRPFVRSGDYFGPDRRRRSDPAFPGPFRRKGDVRPR